jgi:5-methylcytosine-specific restriction protein A
MPTAAPSLFARSPPKRDTRLLDATQRGYGYRWQRERAAYLARNPLCVTCLAAGLTVLASVVDHHVPHRGDMRLFWDVTNWQSLCKRCHDRKTARGE